MDIILKPKIEKCATCARGGGGGRALMGRKAREKSGKDITKKGI